MPRPLPTRQSSDPSTLQQSDPSDLRSLSQDCSTPQAAQPVRRRPQFGESEHGHPRQFGEFECG